MSDQEDNREEHPFHFEGSSLVFDKLKSPEETTSDRRAHEQHEFARVQVRTNRRLAWFTALLVIGTFIGTGIGIWQSLISQKAANAAKAAADASKQAVDIAQQTLGETERSNARGAALAKDSLEASKNQFRQDQRAYITATLEISDDLSDDIGRKSIAVHFVNIGRTPALSVVVSGVYAPGSANSNDVLEFEEPAYDGLTGVYLSNIGDGKGTVKEKNDPNRSISAWSIARQFPHRGIGGGFNTYGIIQYKDIFGGSHETGFCNEYPINGPRRACTFGNWFDKRPKGKNKGK